MTSDVQSDAAGVAAPRVMRAPAPLIATPLVALILIAAIGGYALDWGWTGFKDNGSVWDWLHPSSSCRWPSRRCRSRSATGGGCTSRGPPSGWDSWPS